MGQHVVRQAVYLDDDQAWFVAVDDILALGRECPGQRAVVRVVIAQAEQDAGSSIEEAQDERHGQGAEDAAVHGDPGDERREQPDDQRLEEQAEQDLQDDGTAGHQDEERLAAPPG